MQKEDGGMFQRFFHSEVSGSIVLMFCTIIALFLANSGWSEWYFNLALTKIGISWGDYIFSMTLEHWIADGLMVIFFFVVGLEIKREVVVGQLSSLQQAILPVSAALGGMMIPALFYFILNPGGESASGWGIPMATDIAFALGILALFGSRVPISLKIFLTALAIADDLGAVMVIAIFYTEKIVMTGLLTAGIFMILIIIANRLGIRQMWIYLLLAIGAWAGILASGVHATVAGVLVAMLVPVKSAIEPGKFLSITKKRLDQLVNSKLTKQSMVTDTKQMEALDEMYLVAEDMRPAGLSLEHQLHPVQSFIILPLFALFNAGVEINADSISQLGGSVSLGIFLGLFFGKQIGILFFSWLAVHSGKTHLPEGVRWPHIWGVSILAGVGFTMSIFISDLAFKSVEIIGQAKLAIIVASLIAGITGYIFLHMTLDKNVK